jgi:hypothetical protein
MIRQKGREGRYEREGKERSPCFEGERVSGRRSNTKMPPLSQLNRVALNGDGRDC